ncbi:universal stress protein [Actinokineospora bangkokensis]|uniref:UspA domain-containing protein n=1 Tax=Actinokineospora bangkokensis TaxID=1193682 RepID=A0A1Q9LR18_9PSEU|nr:universal stress protein [Actinokineospora bangkokensis]OLR94462.1 hypothetical protein BJP25_11965 [Actinokineospora bangkokensis]
MVGVDGSDAAWQALRWAAAETGLRGAPLLLVHAGDVGGGGRGVLSRARTLVRALAPGTETRVALRPGPPERVLVDAAAGEALLVTGGRGLGSTPRSALGSVSAAVVECARCPVVVVRGPAPDTGPVVVGVDGTPASDSAVAMAFAEAALRGAPLVAVHTFSDVAFTDLWTVLPLDVDRLAVEGVERQLLADRLSGARQAHPDVEVRLLVRRDRPVRALLAEAAGARLVVVGSRGAHTGAGMGLGSTSRTLTRLCDCPVAVVHPSDPLASGPRSRSAGAARTCPADPVQHRLIP